MAERRYKPTPENERLVKQFIESSKRAGYDPTFTNIIVKEVEKDRSGSLAKKVNKAQSSLEKKVSKLPPLKALPPETASKEEPVKGKRKGKGKAMTPAQVRAFAKRERDKEVGALARDHFTQFLKEAGRDVVLPMAIGGGLGVAFKMASKVPNVVRFVKALDKTKKLRAGKRPPKQLPRGRSRQAVDAEVIPPTPKPGPGTSVARRNRQTVDAEVVPKRRLKEGMKQLTGRRGLPGKAAPKQLKAGRPKPSAVKPDPTIGRLAAEKGRQLNKKQLEKIANEYASRGKAANRPLTKLERIAEDYIRKPNPSKLERLAEAYIRRPKPKPRVRLKSPSKTIRKETVIGKLARDKGAQLNKKELERIANAYAGRGQSAKRPLTRLERLAEDYVNKPTPSKLERIADAYIKQPKKPSVAQLEKMANAYIKGPYARKLGLNDEISASLKSFLQAEGIKNAQQLRSSFASLVSKLKSSAKPARARELQRLLNLSGR